MAKSILVVEDEPNIVLSLQFLMKKAGFEVRVASDGEQALREVETRAPDLILLDVMIDLKFLNAELKRLQRKPIAWKRAVDTVEVARKKFPGAPANLDALCRRFEIDLSDRELHGALKDSHLLAAVYLELLGGRQPGLVLAKTVHDTDVTRTYKRVPRLVQPTPEEAALHEAFIDRLKDPLWRKLL